MTTNPHPSEQRVVGQLGELDHAVLSRLADNWQAAFMIDVDHIGTNVVGSLIRLRNIGLAQSKMGGAQCLNWAITPTGKSALLSNKDQ